MIVTNGKIYERCGDCGKVVRINKWIFGSQHACLLPEEKAEKRRRGIGDYPPLDEREMNQ